jgi:hypothetical protein
MSCAFFAWPLQLRLGDYNAAIDRAVEGLLIKREKQANYVYLLEEALPKQERDLN